MKSSQVVAIFAIAFSPRVALISRMLNSSKPAATLRQKQTVRLSSRFTTKPS